MAEDEEDKKKVPGKAEKRKRRTKNRLGPRSRKAKVRREEKLKAKAGAEDSEEEDDEGEESEEEAAAGEKAAVKNKKTKANRLEEADYDRPDRGVVFVGQLPDGLFEPQLMKYFKQFGNVTRLRVARSKKTGNTKGYGWVEFEEMEVAQIVAQTMNKYMIFGKVLSVELLPREKVPPGLFRNWRRKWKDLSRRKRKAHREGHNDRPKVEVEGEQLPQVTLSQVRRRETNLSKLKAKLEQLGIEYDLSPFEEGRDEAVAAAEAERKRAGDEAAAAKERAKAAEADAAAARAAPAPKRAVAKQPAKAPRPSPAEVVAKAAEAAETAAEAPKAAKAGKAAKAAKAAAVEEEEPAEAKTKKKKKRKAAAAAEAEEEVAEGAPPASCDGAAGAESGQKSPARKKKKKHQGA